MSRSFDGANCPLTVSINSKYMVNLGQHFTALLMEIFI